MPRVEKLPPSAAKIFLLSLLALAADGAYRWFFFRLFPDATVFVFNRVPGDLAVLAGALPCALFFYWLSRLRYRARLVLNLPAHWGAELLVFTGLAAAALCHQSQSPLGALVPATVLPRLAGLAAALGAAACEECAFRGSLFLSAQELGGKYGDALALGLGSLGFGLLHAAYQAPWSLAFAAAAGLALGVARLRGSSLGSLILAHVLLGGVAALWLSPISLLAHTPELEAAGLAALTALLLWFLPAAQHGSNAVVT
ncbi:MAG: CPBP family glutamic-type intramembrane protease [bacterium]